jgi:hypothetical protein
LRHLRQTSHHICLKLELANQHLRDLLFEVPRIDLARVGSFVVEITFPLLIYVETFSNPIPSSLFNSFILIILFTPTLTPRPQRHEDAESGL